MRDMAIAKARAAREAGGASGAQASCKTLEGFPTVWEYLTATTFDDGSARETATVSVFVEEGLVKVALNDRAERRSAYVTGSDLRAALKALEGILGAGEVDWRLWSNKAKKK
jgi:hypothetical protein